VYGIEPGEIDIASVHQIKRAWLSNQDIENIDIVQFSIGNMDELGNTAS